MYNFTIYVTFFYLLINFYHFNNFVQKKYCETQQKQMLWIPGFNRWNLILTESILWITQAWVYLQNTNHSRVLVIAPPPPKKKMAT